MVIMFLLGQDPFSATNDWSASYFLMPKFLYPGNPWQGQANSVDKETVQHVASDQDLQGLL